MKRILTIVLALGIVMSLSLGALAAFPDMPQGEAGTVLQKAVDNGLINGFDDGTIQPGTPITRAQMAAIMSRAMGMEALADVSSFVDIKAEDWFYADMAKAVNMGAFKGDDKSRLNPNKTISRQEAFIVLSRIFDTPQADTSVLKKYSDGSSVAQWAAKEVASIAAAGYMGSIEQIRPLDAMTRLEFAEVMDRLVTTYIDADGEYTSLPDGNVLVRAKNVSFKGVVTDDVLLIGDGITTDVNFTDCTVERLVLRNKNTILNSGTYTRVRTVGRKSVVRLMKSPLDLVKKFDDGKIGSIYASPEMDAVIVPLIINVDSIN